MYLHKELSDDILNRMYELRESFEEINDKVDVWFTGEYYVVQTQNEDDKEIEFRWEVFDDTEFIDTFTVFCDVIIFLANNQVC